MELMARQNKTDSSEDLTPTTSTDWIDSDHLSRMSWHRNTRVCSIILD